MSTPFFDGSPDQEAAVRMAGCWRDMFALQSVVKQDREAGQAALRRLLPIAMGYSGQCRQVAAVLLGCYNGRRFPLDLTNLRGLDYPILEDVLAVLRMDANAQQEVRCYFDRGGSLFEKLAESWGFNQVDRGLHG